MTLQPWHLVILVPGAACALVAAVALLYLLVLMGLESFSDGPATGSGRASTDKEIA